GESDGGRLLSRFTDASIDVANIMSMYVFISDLGEDHAELIERFGTFTDARPSRPKLTTRQVALVSVSGEAVDAIGRMTRGRKVASFKWLVRLDELVVLEDA